MLLQSSEDETIRRVAAGAVANLAMNGKSFLHLAVSWIFFNLEVMFSLHISSERI